MPVSGVPGWVRKLLALLHKKVDRRMLADRQDWINSQCARGFDRFNPHAASAVAFAQALYDKLSDHIPDDQSDARKKLKGILSSIEKADIQAANCKTGMRTTMRNLLGLAYDWGYDKIDLFAH